MACNEIQHSSFNGHCSVSLWGCCQIDDEHYGHIGKLCSLSKLQLTCRIYRVRTDGAKVTFIDSVSKEAALP